MTYDISVITPSYNQGQFIEQTIKSVLTQCISNLQYLIIDGKSSDNTVSVLNKYNEKIEWLSEKDSGQANALNKGFKLATGEIIGWLNSDDIYFPGTLSAVLDFFRNNPDVDILYGDADHIDENNQSISRYPTEKWNIKRFMDHCFLSQPAVFFRRKLFDEFGFLDENLQFCMDYEFWLRLATGGARFYHYPKLLSATRLHSQAKTITDSIKAHKEQINMIKRYQHCIPMRMIVAYAHAILKNEMKNKILLYIYIIFNSINLAIRHNGFYRGIGNILSLPGIIISELRKLRKPRVSIQQD